MSRKKVQKNNKRSNTLRIIGGEWRSRKLSFIDAEGLRPTPDRIRETLFNWLQGRIYGAHCLDLFAGSGVIGLEALSRGAAKVDFVEKNKAVAKQLESNLQILKSDTEVQYQDAVEYLIGYKTSKKGGGVYHIIFLDPPYRLGFIEKTLHIICHSDNELVDSDTLIYLEHESEESIDWNIFGLKVIKEANAGQVKSYLLGF